MEIDENEKYEPIFQAVGSGDWDSVKIYLEKYPEALTVHKMFGYTPLLLAVWNEKVDIVRELVKLMSPQDLEIRDNYGSHALDLSAVLGNTEIAKLLVEKNSNLPTIPGQHGFLPLVTALNECKDDTASYLYTVTPNELLQSNMKGGDLVTQEPLFHAVHLGYWDFAEEHLKKYPEALAVRIRGETPLLAAIWSWTVDIAKELVKLMSPQDLEIRGEWRGYHALSLAAYLGRTEVAKVLVDKNCNLLSIPDEDGILPLETALRRRNYDIVSYLYTVTPKHVLQSDLPGANHIFKFIESLEQEFKPFLNAVESGDWSAAEEFTRCRPKLVVILLRLTSYKAFRVAIKENHEKMVEELVKLLNPEDLEMKYLCRLSSLAIAAERTGNITIAKCLIQQNKNLLTFPNKYGLIPLAASILAGFADMARFLYWVTPMEALEESQAASIIASCITIQSYDIALDLLQRYPKIATTRQHGVDNPLSALVFRPSAYLSGTKFNLFQRLIYEFIHVQLPSDSHNSRVNVEETSENQKSIDDKMRSSGFLCSLVSRFRALFGIDKIYGTKVMHKKSRLLLKVISKEIVGLSESALIESVLFPTILKALEFGIEEIISEMIKARPDLLTMRMGEEKTIFTLAIEHRQEKIFNYIFGLDKNDLMEVTEDQLGRKMLTLAAERASSRKLNRIAGAALQMQRELQWFNEVQSVVPATQKDSLNQEGQTPRQLFTEKHAGLAKDGMEWMKGTASSYTLVGALIVTVTFAAAFTLPGGNDQNTGLPMFLHKKLLKVFAISDTISLFSSASSVLMFLGILTSRFAEEDFVKSLPTKLMIGLFTLLLSIISMVIAFCAALLLSLRGQIETAIPSIFIACFPILLFLWLQCPLLFEIFSSTYIRSSVFGKKGKRNRNEM